MPGFRLTERAFQDLRDISTYTKAAWGAEQERHYRHQLKLELQRLSLNANMGRSREELGRGMRSHRVAAHIAFYIHDSDGITIIRLLHPSRDIERAFRRHPDKLHDQSP